jgi:ankyrin repeat protein
MKNVPLNPIYLAITSGDCDEVNRLAENGLAPAFQTDNDHWNLLHWLLVGISPDKTPSSEMIEYLIHFGVDVNGRDRFQWTPLHYACRAKRRDAVRLLLKAGADPNSVDEDGITPLHRNLVEETSLEIIELLLQFGADPLANSPGPNAANMLKVIDMAEKPQIEALISKYRKNALASTTTATAQPPSNRTPKSK